ncbi:MAG: hypothetical protein H8J66_14810 [Nitrospira sp.]|nr:hypothetical protein [Nitrospira sp.]
MTLLWLAALGVACIAVGIVLIGVGYLVGLRVATRQAAGLVANVREEMVQAKAERAPGVVQWSTR